MHFCPVLVHRGHEKIEQRGLDLLRPLMFLCWDCIQTPVGRLAAVNDEIQLEATWIHQSDALGLTHLSQLGSISNIRGPGLLNLSVCWQSANELYWQTRPTVDYARRVATYQCELLNCQPAKAFWG